MANVDSPFGLKPIRHLSGAPYNGACNAYYCLSTYAVALFIGDPVIKVASGSNTAAYLGYAIGTLPAIQVCACTDGLVPTGVIVGFGPNRNDLSKAYKPASTESLVWVADDPDLIFEVQADGAVPAASMGLNGNLIATHSGNTLTNMSGYELDSGTTDGPAGDPSNPLTVIRAVNREDNDTTITHAKVEVRFNLHSEIQGTTGV